MLHKDVSWGAGGGGGSIRSYTDFICKIGFKLWALRLFN